MPASAGRVEASVEDSQTRPQTWFCVSRDQRWRPSWFADTARGHGRASRGEKRQRSSGHRSACAPHPPAPQPESPRRVGAPRGAPLCQDEDLRGSSGPVGGWPPSPAACGPDGGEGGAWFAPGRSMVQGPALLGALRATTHLPCVWAAGRRAAAVGSAKGYGDLRRTPRLATLERPRE
jgi:hypothetical protein